MDGTLKSTQSRNPGGVLDVARFKLSGYVLNGPEKKPNKPQADATSDHFNMSSSNCDKPKLVDLFTKFGLTGKIHFVHKFTNANSF